MRKIKAMEVVSNKIDRENLKPGDHIYSWSVAYAYSHHGALPFLPLFLSLYSSFFIFIYFCFWGLLACSN